MFDMNTHLKHMKQGNFMCNSGFSGLGVSFTYGIHGHGNLCWIPTLLWSRFEMSTQSTTYWLQFSWTMRSLFIKHPMELNAWIVDYYYYYYCYYYCIVKVKSIITWHEMFNFCNNISESVRLASLKTPLLHNIAGEGAKVWSDKLSWWLLIILANSTLALNQTFRYVKFSLDLSVGKIAIIFVIGIQSTQL